MVFRKLLPLASALIHPQIGIMEHFPPSDTIFIILFQPNHADRTENSTVAFLLQTQSCERWVPVGRRFKKRLEIPLSGACMTERGEIMHMPDSVKSSPLSHGYPALMSEGKWWKGKG